MNGIWLLLPFLAIRFGLLGLMDKGAIKRAAFFAPREGLEKIMYIIYQVSNIGMIVFLLFTRIHNASIFFYIGIGIYTLGLFICAISIISFSKPQGNGINTNGIYRVSRNPLYVGYFLYYLGCALLTQSIVLVVLVVIFQVATHWIILSEERWCLSTFGEDYRRYMNKVRRYL